MGNETTRLASAAEKRRQALELRKAGVTYRDIAQKVGWKSVGSAKKAVDQELAAIPRDAAKELMSLELERLDLAQVAIWKQIRSGDQFAIDRLIKIMDHRAKLTGLYQTQTEDNSEAVKRALLDFAGSLKHVFGGDDGYGSEFIPDDSSPEAHSELGNESS